MRARIGLAAIGATLLLAGCGQAELYGGLDEREVNEMLAVVESNGIDASKASKDGESWSLKTSSQDFPEAVAVLNRAGYPKEDFASLGDLFKKEGFVSSPLEERARLVYGLQEELSHTISSIDGVVQARVHLAVPESDPLSETQKPSSASVFVKHSPDVELSSQIGSIKALVVNSIEGLPYEKVTVVLVPAKPLLAASSPHPLSPEKLQTPITATVLIGVGAIAALGALRRRRTPTSKTSREAA